MYHLTLDRSFLVTVSTFFILFSPFKKIEDGAEAPPPSGCTRKLSLTLCKLSYNADTNTKK